MTAECTQTEVLPHRLRGKYFPVCYQAVEMRRQLGNIHIEEEIFSGLKRDSFAGHGVGHCGAAVALLFAFQGRKWPFKTKHFSLFL